MVDVKDKKLLPEAPPKRSARDKPMRSARNKLMDLLARRDHSEKELRTKLKQRNFTSVEIDAAISDARDRKWLGPPEEIGGKYADSLHGKNKGIHYINHHLQGKGLPTIKMDPDLELEKARRLVENKFSGVDGLSKILRARVGRFLTSRGFDAETIRKIIFENRFEK